MGKILFFGYGANKDPHRLKEILGKYPEGGQGAVLENYSLAVQTLKQIPTSAQHILKKVWGENFQAYTIRKGNGFVEGRIWLIEEEDLEKIKKWEFIGDENWREVATAQATTSEGKSLSVITEKSKDSYLVEKIVDGLNYESNINVEGKKYYSKEDEYRMSLLRNEIKNYHGNGFVFA
ncbi:MAG: gamma-glutamylcyclotransferase [Candidatus Roizmanbacteria bacterium]|nr:gamma-glutamylcyclotransferase [Candidatus Roizmanbacteria bacterium]